MAVDETEPALTAEIDANIARNLRIHREARGWSQSELAQHLNSAGVPGFHQTTVARIEGGQRPLRAAEAIAICRALEISLEWLSESGRSARLRSEASYLHEKSQSFDAAARELLHAWRVAAMNQDQQFPYGPDGMADQDEILRSGVEPRLYEILESRLVSATPHERLSITYQNELAQGDIWSRPEGAEHRTRVEIAREWMQDFLTALEDEPRMVLFHDRRQESNELFEREVLSLFETATDGIDQATP